MKTSHKIIVADSRQMQAVASESIDLVITSPPYPMIQMWDSLFCLLSEKCNDALKENRGRYAFELMHCELDKVWNELYRVMKPGAFACINIGDATRKIGNSFELYGNHARIITYCNSIGFYLMPLIIWRKKTNAPNKFMGSGMLPPGAYVTLEHEYVLVFRKGEKQTFASASEKLRRRNSAFFWEERNVWFSDLWEFKGTRQKLHNSELRSRSAAFPFELAYRLVNMYSLYGDTILDPFMGTGTTSLAAIASGRNSISMEIDNAFTAPVISSWLSFVNDANLVLAERVDTHTSFVKECIKNGKPVKYTSSYHGFPVITRQETDILLHGVTTIRQESSVETTSFHEPFDQIPNKNLF
jgi:DNA modification methylase